MIGPYRLERVLGTGSFATVWLAHDDVLDRKVAVKILADNWSRDNDVRRRFLAEARVLLTVESPRIVRAFHIDESPAGQPYLVMAYADRGTLGDRIDRRRSDGRRFDTRETVAIVTEVALALVDVHASGHLHRDVKPSNVLIRSSSTRRNIAGLASDETVVLGDFGLARGLDLSALTMVAGSPGYVAPEQAAGLTQLDRRADLYPLGRMMLEMLAGDPGGRATTMAGAAAEEIDVVALLSAAGGDAPGAPTPELIRLVERLVAKNPDSRPRSAEEVVAALGAIGAQLSGGGLPAGPPSGPPAWAPGVGGGQTGTQLGAAPAGRSFGAGRTRAVVAGAGAVGALAIVGVALALAGGDGGGGGDTSAPAVVADSTEPGDVTTPEGSAAVTEPVGRPIATVPDTAESSGPPPASSGVPATATATTEEAIATTAGTAADSTERAESSAPGQQRLVLPQGAYTPEALDAATVDPDRQEGSVLMSAEQFAAALVEANPQWHGDVPAVNDDGTLDVELGGFGRTAAVHIEPAAVTSGAVIVSFVIEYS
jgi:hypothetical protein